MSQIKKVLSVIIAFAMIFSGVSSFALEEEKEVIYLVVENTTYTDEDAPWSGKLIDNLEVEIEEGETTASTAIIKGLQESGHTQVGAEEGYITSVDSLGEFGSGKQGGWMVSVNDWFTSAGINDICVSGGDIITLMYTCNFGEDVGSFWANNNKALKSITFSKGELNEEFSPEIFEYTLTIPSDAETISVTPVAENKNFQTRTYLNTEIKEENGQLYIDGEEEYEAIISGLSPWSDIPQNIGFYKKSEEIPVKNGDVITVGCGFSYWSSMNNGDFGSGAEEIAATAYKFKIEKEKSDISVFAGVYDYTAVKYKKNNPENEISVSENGKVFEKENCVLKEGISVLDALKEIFEKEEIEYSLDESGTYIKSIGTLSEMDCESQSGWMISVNDKFLETSASDAFLNDGDILKLHYSVEGWGTDVGNYFAGGPFLRKISLGGVESIISSNTVYKDENDWTGTTTYYLGEYVENGVNTPIDGEGSASMPYIIPIKVGAEVSLDFLTAIVQTSLDENYLSFSDEEGLSDIRLSQNYENDVDFAIETLGGFYKTYYKIKVTKEEAVIETPVYSGSSSSRKPSKTKEKVEEEEKLQEKLEEKTNHNFTDTKGHWAEKYIERLNEENIIKGKSEASFAPDDKITRAELVALLYRLSEENYENTTIVFDDVNETDWFSSSVLWAKENNIASGINEKEFKPNEFVSREQSAVFIIRFCELMKYEYKESGEKSFSDSKKLSDWSRENVIKAQKYGIISGFEDGSFKPQGSLTRAQIAKMICVMLDERISKE